MKCQFCLGCSAIKCLLRRAIDQFYVCMKFYPLFSRQTLCLELPFVFGFPLFRSKNCWHLYVCVHLLEPLPVGLIFQDDAKFQFVSTAPDFLLKTNLPNCRITKKKNKIKISWRTLCCLLYSFCYQGKYISYQGSKSGLSALAVGFTPRCSSWWKMGNFDQMAL